MGSADDAEADVFFVRRALAVGLDLAGREREQQVAERAAKRDRIMVVLDSNHTHEHVLGELDSFS